MKPVISGIQQAGIGVPDVQKAFEYYNKTFGMDVPVFEEAAVASLMLPYTGGVPRARHAILALNMRGGGGFEIWQYTDREPQQSEFDIRLGDLGINILKIKTSNINKAFSHVINHGSKVLTEIQVSFSGKKNFFVADFLGNIFEVVEHTDFFSNKPGEMGGICGATIGVSDITESKLFYKTILGYDTIVFDKSSNFKDLYNLLGGKSSLTRALLTHEHPRKGPFSKLLGSSYIELVQMNEDIPKKIFENRLWGDLGFIHLCFDIQGMTEMKALCNKFGHPFTVDSSNSFDMGQAAGHFSYIEDPDGTLIEFVETHKIPLIKALSWNLNLKNRSAEKAIPSWMLKTMAFRRKKF